MSEMLLAHGGTAGLFFEIAFLALPIVVFSAMAVISGRRRRAADAEPDVEAGP